MVTESTGAPQRKSHYLLEISSMGVLYHDVPLCLSCHLKKKKHASLISSVITTTQCCLCTSQSFDNPGHDPTTTIHINTFRHQTNVMPFGQKEIDICCK